MYDKRHQVFALMGEFWCEMPSLFMYMAMVEFSCETQMLLVGDPFTFRFPKVFTHLQAQKRRS